MSHEQETCRTETVYTDSNGIRRALSIFSNNCRDRNMEPRVSCRVCCKCSASPITNTADLQMLGDLLSFSIFCKNQNLSMKLCSVAQTRRCRTINISAANGRVLLILLPLVRATNDLFLFLSHLTLQAPANIWQRLKCSKLGIETGARSDKFFHRLIPF